MFTHLAKYCLLAAVIAPVIAIPKFDLSFGKYVFFRVFVELAAVLVIAGWAFRNPPVLQVRASRIVRHPVIIAVLVFAAVFLTSTAFAFDRSAAFWSTYSRGEGAFQLLHYCAFLILLVLLFRDAGDWRRLFLVSLIAGCASIAYGFLWPAGMLTSVYPQDLPIPDNSGFWGKLMGHQFVGSIGNPIWAGSYFAFQMGYLAWLLAGRYTVRFTFTAVAAGVLGAVSCYGVILALQHSRTWAGFLGFAIASLGLFSLLRTLGTRSGNGRAVTLSVLASTLLFFAFLLSGSRGAALGLFAAVLTVAMFFVPWRRWLASLLLIGTLAGCATYAFRELPFLDATSADYRLQYWRTAWTGFLERPLLGWGPENYTAIHDRYGRVLWPVDHSHSILFDGLAATGALGTASLLAVFVVCGWVLHRAVRSADLRAPAAKAQLAIVAALIGSYVIQGLFAFDWLPVSLNLYLSFACLVWLTPDPPMRTGEAENRPPPAPERIPNLKRYSAAVAAMLAIAWIGYAGNYLPLAKAAAFQRALDSRLETWDECREAFNRSFLISAPFGQDELLHHFGASVTKLLLEEKKSPAEVALWEGYFRRFADALAAREGASMVRTLETAGEVETAAFKATGDPVYFARAEMYQRRGLFVNPLNLMLLRGQFDLNSAAGRTQEARRIARTIQAIWPVILTPDPRIEAALLPK